MINYLQVENLTKSYGDLVLFDNISFTIGEGQRIALIGRNGSGKTTLLNILAGKDTADSGTITPRRDLRIAYLEQNPEYAADLTVLEACFRSDNPALRAIAAYEQAVADPAQDGLQEAMSRMDALAAWDYEQRAKEILSRLKINDFDKKIGQLSGGQLKRVALAAVLISEADLLILDEATAGLDPLAREEALDILRGYMRDERHGILMSSHITSDLEKVADYVTYLHRGRVAVSGAKDELLDTYGKLVCGRSELERVDPALLVGVRSGQFGCEALVKNRRAFARFHPELAVEPVSLEDIMVFTVKGDAR